MRPLQKLREIIILVNKVYSGEKGYSNKDNLRQHIKEKHIALKPVADIMEQNQSVSDENGRLSCPFQCKEKFGSRLALTAHINEKHETKKEIYECDMCEKKSSSLYNLRRHL